MEPRWIRQRDGYSCGPIAICNVAKWASIHPWDSWEKSRERLGGLCRTSRTHGTSNASFESALRSVGRGKLKIVRRARWKLDELAEWIEERGCIVIDFVVPLAHNMAKAVNNRDAHYVTVVDIMGPKGSEWFKVINIDSSETVSWVSREQFNWLFMRRRKGDRIWKVKLS